MTRQMQERTEKLGIMGDRVDRLEENSGGWVDDVNSMCLPRSWCMASRAFASPPAS